MNTTLETLTNKIEIANIARVTFDSVPLVVRRRSLASKGQRFATIEQVDAQRQLMVNAPLYAAKMEFLESIRAEVDAKRVITPDEQREIDELAAQKEENARLEMEFAKALDNE